MDVQCYTMEQALDDSFALLEARFGKPDQDACVSLANMLYTTRIRDEFALRHEEDLEIVR